MEDVARLMSLYYLLRLQSFGDMPLSLQNTSRWNIEYHPLLWLRTKQKYAPLSSKYSRQLITLSDSRIDMAFDGGGSSLRDEQLVKVYHPALWFEEKKYNQYMGSKLSLLRWLHMNWMGNTSRQVWSTSLQGSHSYTRWYDRANRYRTSWKINPSHNESVEVHSKSIYINVEEDHAWKLYICSLDFSSASFPCFVDVLQQSRKQTLATSMIACVCYIIKGMNDAVKEWWLKKWMLVRPLPLRIP